MEWEGKAARLSCPSPPQITFQPPISLQSSQHPPVASHTPGSLLDTSIPPTLQPQSLPPAPPCWDYYSAMLISPGEVVATREGRSSSLPAPRLPTNPTTPPCLNAAPPGSHCCLTSPFDPHPSLLLPFEPQGPAGAGSGCTGSVWTAGYREPGSRQKGGTLPALSVTTATLGLIGTAIQMAKKVRVTIWMYSS